MTEVSPTGPVVEMTYVGIHTKTYLWSCQHGTRTLATTKRERRLRAKLHDDVLFSLDEAINIMERQQGILKTPEEISADIAEYQKAIAAISREPDAYVAPDLARGWYEQQIERIQALLQLANAAQEGSHV